MAIIQVTDNCVCETIRFMAVVLMIVIGPALVFYLYFLFKVTRDKHEADRRNR